MAGCKLVVISGIDGCFDEFEMTVEPFLKGVEFLKIPYNRNLSFKHNVEIMTESLDNEDELFGIIGWSIGGVAATFLSSLKNVGFMLIVNSFFSRSEILQKRNITCDEEVCVLSTHPCPNIKYVFIAGKQDNKIHYTESIKIMSYFKLPSNSLRLFETAAHDLSSFPHGSIANEIINAMTWIA